MSKWGIEEKETIDAIEKIKFNGYILNVAAGDGRFNNKILESADKVIAIDILESELKLLKEDCHESLKDKLFTKVLDITQKIPFEDDKFDGIFCTGTLHLFKKETIAKILEEMSRVLKKNGKILLDFATDIRRLDKNNNPVIFDDEGNYHTEEAIDFFKEQLNNFDLNIEVSKFIEEDLEEGVGYSFIEGNFLIISGKKIK